ncbi:MAG: sulfatase [Rikenellaceae bacterium]
MIFCDDLGYGDLSCFGHPTIFTPTLDSLSQVGQKWTSFYVSSPTSSPSRAGLLTGCYGTNSGMYGNVRNVLFPDSEGGLPQDQLTIAQELKTVGYTTACFGKWHLGHLPEYMPLEHGFDRFFGFPFSNDMSRQEQAKMGNPNYPHEYLVYDQDQIVEREPDQTQLVKRLTEQTVAFIEENKKEPFFVYLAHPMTHLPVYASERFAGKSKRGVYGDAVAELDWCVSEIVRVLDENKLSDNTIVIFTSDNGPWLGYGESSGSAGLLRDGKASTYEGGFRVPTIIWGASVKPAQISKIGTTLDLLPTFCSYAGITPTNQVDGVSLREVFETAEGEPRDEFFYYRGGVIYAVRKGDYKLHQYTQGAYGDPHRLKLESPTLYNLEKDPAESKDISAENPQVVKELLEMIEKQEKNYPPKEPIFDLKSAK